MKIAITGVCGLIGRRLASHLLDGGHQIYGIGRSKCDNIDKLLLSNYILLDLASKDSIQQLTNRLPSNIDLIIDCASQQPREGLIFQDYRKGNIDTTESIIEWARSIGADAIISFSTIAFLDFPEIDDIKITESTRENPKNYYALSKWVSETYLRFESKDYNFKVFCFRIPSLVHQEQQGGLINTYYKSAKENKNIDIFDKGKFRRTLINMESIIEVIDLTIKKLDKFQGFNLFNIGSEDSWTLFEIANYIYQRMDATAKIFPINQSSNISGHCNIDSSKAKNEIDFVPWSTNKILDDYLEKMSGEN
jgi:nucleoside-diphosphate-sugar epimerase